MVKSREHVTTNGRAVFFAAMWEDFRNAASDCGWALGLHGSLNSDMDIMAMPWTAEAVPAAELIQALLNCFDDSIWKEKEYKPFTHKPHGRIVYTISIFADFYLDISIMDVNSGIKSDIIYAIGETGVNGHPDPIGRPGYTGPEGYKGIVLGNNDPIGDTENVEHLIPNQINKIEFMDIPSIRISKAKNFVKKALSGYESYLNFEVKNNYYSDSEPEEQDFEIIVTNVTNSDRVSLILKVHDVEGFSLEKVEEFQSNIDERDFVMFLFLHSFLTHNAD